jgi:hypothetical protein
VLFTIDLEFSDPLTPAKSTHSSKSGHSWKASDKPDDFSDTELEDFQVRSVSPEPQQGSNSTTTAPLSPGGSGEEAHQSSQRTILSL